LCISHIKVNLNTKDVATARRLAALLDARAVEVFAGEMQNLDKEQLGSIFRSVLVEHRAKLGMLADLERQRPTRPRATLLDDELAQGVAYTLLSEQGLDAHVTSAMQERLAEKGHGTDFISKVIEQLEALRDENGIKFSRLRLKSHVKQAGGEINASNLARAETVYLRALGAALMEAAGRYSTEPTSELDFEALIHQSKTEPSTPMVSPKPIEAAIEPVSQSPAAAPVAVAEERREDDKIRTMLWVGNELDIDRRQDDAWDVKTGRQAQFIFALFAKFMSEIHQIEDVRAVR